MKLREAQKLMKRNICIVKNRHNYGRDLATAKYILEKIGAGLDDTERFKIYKELCEEFKL